MPCFARHSIQALRVTSLFDKCTSLWVVVQIMVPGKTDVSLTFSWSTDYDPVAAAEQSGAGKLGLRGDDEAQVRLKPCKSSSSQQAACSASLAKYCCPIAPIQLGKLGLILVQSPAATKPLTTSC